MLNLLAEAAEEGGKLDWAGLSDLASKLMTALRAYGSITKLIVAIQANPMMWAIGGGIFLAIAIGAYLWIKAKIKKIEIDQAEKTTELDWKDQIEERTPINEDNNIKDNENRNKLDALK